MPVYHPPSRTTTTTTRILECPFPLTAIPHLHPHTVANANASDTDTDLVPAYSPSAAAPPYSLLCSRDEHSLLRSPRMPAACITPTGTFSQSYRHATVNLYNQPQDVTTPVYGSKASIKGDVVLHTTDSVMHVSLQIEGTLQLFTGVAGKTCKIVDESYTLWSASSPPSSESQSTPDQATSSTCPSRLQFSTTFPSTFSMDQDSDQRQQWPLPPSIDLPADLSRITVKCSYRLMIAITQRVLFMTQTKYVPIPITYYPRERPERSMFSHSYASESPYLLGLGAIKTNPEEWVQLSSTVEPRGTRSGLKSVQCHFFVPSVDRYALSNSIPFHLQLIGPFRSLAQLHFPFKESPSSNIYSSSPLSPSPISSNGASPAPVSTPSLTRTPSAPQSISSETKIKLPPNPGRPYIFRTEKESIVRVYLLREAVTCVNGRKGVRRVVIGEGVLRESVRERAPGWRVPPPGLEVPKFQTNVGSKGSPNSGTNGTYPPRGEDICIDWEGEVKVFEKSTPISFDSGCVSFVDYIALHVAPVRANGALLELELKQPIKLVTDGWVEDHFVYANGTAQGTRNGNFT